MNLVRPEFVLSVGDMVEGFTTDRAQLHREWDEFDAMLEPLAAPFFYLPGNHDVGNEAMHAVWNERMRKIYYHFVYQGPLRGLLVAMPSIGGAENAA